MKRYKQLDKNGNFICVLSYKTDPVFTEEELLEHTYIEMAPEEYETFVGPKRAKREAIRQRLEELQNQPPLDAEDAITTTEQKALAYDILMGAAQ